MAQAFTIAIDAMGGDHGPEVVLGGVNLALQRKPHLRFELYGEEARIAPILNRLPAVAAASNVHDCEISIAMDEKPSQALRRGRYKSGMWQAIDAVKQGQAAVSVSAGNTGALMAMAKFCLHTMEGVERPAMAALWPTLRGESIVLDVGANIHADAGQLVDFAVMGAAMARALSGLERPSVGLLNIGVEEVKGQDDVRRAAQILREATPPNLHYHGFVEGGDLGRGTVDVVVTEGFAGNIALKTAEGTARQIAEYFRLAMRRTLAARIGYVFARAAFREVREKMDPGKVNGAVLLGLNGIVIKSHGGTDAEGFASAIEIGHDISASNILMQIKNDLLYFGGIKQEEAQS